MRRSYLTEPLVMLATVLQWLVLSILTGAVVGTGCSLFLRILFETAGHNYAAPLWLQMIALPIAGLANGLLLHYSKRANRTGLKDSVIIAVNDQDGRLPWKTMWVKDALSSVEAAPLRCAGVTTYNGLRNSGASAGDVVAVLGVGGLGHLGVQYAHAMGFHTVALSRGTDKKQLAMELGADTYIDTEAEDAVEALQKLGGARVILATAPNPDLMSSVIDGLGVNGQLLVVGASTDPIKVSPMQLISARRSIAGHPSGVPKDSEDTLHFSALRDIRTRIETFPLKDVAATCERMNSNKARFRVVLQMD